MADASESTMRRTERLLNLVLLLLASPVPVPRERLRAAVAAYAESPSAQAFERMFERDKQDLRDLGIPVLTLPANEAFGDDLGYWIDPGEYRLPPLDLDAEARAVLVLAARAWEQAALGAQATHALRKLGVATEDVPLPPVSPRVDADEVFAQLFAAVRERRAVMFRYRRLSDGAVAERQVQPWTLASRSGAWYLVGHDEDRDAVRVFRLSRIDGEVRSDAPGTAARPPADLDASAVGSMIVPEDESVLVTVRVRPGRGNALRRRAVRFAPGAVDGGDELDVVYGDVERAVADLAPFADDVVVLAPETVRSALVEHLSAALGGKP